MSPALTAPEVFTAEPYWFLHHEVILEWTTEPVANRIAYIEAEKPASERATRLQALRPVKYPERLPLGVVEAGRAYAEAGRAYAEAGRAYAEAGRACDEAGRACDEAWRAYAEAGRACDEAWRAYAEAGRACDEAWRACAEARRGSFPLLVAQYSEEYPENAGCFDPATGHLIFPTAA